MALSPNSKTVATGGWSKVILWDVETARMIATLTVQERSRNVEAVCWSPNGERVLSGGRDGTARVSDVESGETILGPIRTGHRDVCAAAYSPDGSKFATGGFESTVVMIWDSTTGERLHELQHHRDSAIWYLAWASDAEKLISGSRNGEIRIFDTATWNKIADLNAHNSFVEFTLSRNNRFLASTSWDCTARLWDLETNLQVGLPLHHEARVVCGTLSADGMSLVCHDTDANIYTWDVGAILKEHHLEHLLPISDAVSVK
jgi:WD40 repeat protein